MYTIAPSDVPTRHTPNQARKAAVYTCTPLLWINGTNQNPYAGSLYQANYGGNIAISTLQLTTCVESLRNSKNPPPPLESKEARDDPCRNTTPPKRDYKTPRENSIKTLVRTTPSSAPGKRGETSTAAAALAHMS